MSFFRNCMKIIFGLSQSSGEMTVFRRQTADFCHVPYLPLGIQGQVKTLSYSRELTAQQSETD